MAFLPGQESNDQSSVCGVVILHVCGMVVISLSQLLDLSFPEKPLFRALLLNVVAVNCDENQIDPE